MPYKEDRGSGRRRYYSAFGCLFALLLLWPTTAEGQTFACGDRNQIIESLDKIHGEILRYRAVTDSNWLFELYLSEEKRTWTILVTSPMGVSCPTGSGTGWQVVSPEEEGERI